MIEHSITGGRIDFSIAGVGLNVNEQNFPDYLPNPISLCQISGKEYDLGVLHTKILQSMSDMLEDFLLGNFSSLHERYMNVLYRRLGWHSFRVCNGQFIAEIKAVLPTGQLVLQLETGEERIYNFKEVVFDAN